MTAEERAALSARGMALTYWSRRIPDRQAVVSAFGSRTFAELDARANQLARALRRRGLAPGDAVALICGNAPAFVETVVATQRAGLRLTPVNWHLTAGEAAYIVADCEARALVAERGVDAAFEQPPPPSCGVVLATGTGPDRPGTEDYEEALERESPDDLEDAVAGTTMLYTSGTTGRPKGVHRDASVPSILAENRYGYREGEGDVHLCTGPLYHAAPLAFSLAIPLALGVGVVLMERFEPVEALALVERHRVTHSHMVPTMFHRLLSLPDEVRARYDLSSLRHVLHGAAPCPVTMKQRLIEWLGPIVWEYYAATEGVGSFVDPATWLAHPGTVGRPMTEGQVIVADDEGRPLPVGETGLVFLRAPALGRFDYFKDPEKTAASYRGDYFTLGDVGHFDDDGFLYLTDRSSNVVISGGVNIYPAEVDAVLLEHPAVADAATIGVPDEEWGERLLAVVQPRAGVEGTPHLAAELIEHCRRHLARFKCPREVDFTDQLPRQDNGKLYKRLLRERYREAAR